MAQAYLSVKVRRALKFSVQVLGRLENNRAVNLVNKQRFAIILCLTLVFSAAGGYVTGTARAAEDNYLLDKVIEWPDGTSERVQIGEDGYFILDGVKKRLVCVNLHIFLPYGNPDLYGGVPPYWLPENLAIYERELSWLQSKGVRVITFDPHYVGWGDGPGHEAERYSPVFDLIYQHKMLFIPQIEGKGMPGFDNLTNPDFVIIDWANETMGTYATRYRDILLNYPNLVGMLLDNELNHPNSGQTYTPAALQNYLSFLRGIFTPLNVPMVNNLVGRLPSYHPDLALATLEATDWQCFTLYAGNLTEYRTVLSNLRSWLAGAGYPTDGWWLEETNKTAGAATGDAANYTIEYLESAFDSGASLVSLFCTNGEGAGGETGFSFFDDAGNPIPSMEAIGAEIERLQTPMSGPSTPPTVVTSDASSVTADSARLNGNLSNLGSSSTVNVSFQWGTSPESYTNETIPQTMGATGPFNFDLTGLNSGSTYYFRAKAVGYGTHYGEGKSFTTTGSVNHPPVLNPIGNKSVNEGQLLEFAISATDPDGDPLTYSASNLPSGATFDTGIHTFSWTPASGQADTYTDAHFEADDGSLTDSEDITIVVSTPGTSGSGGGGGGGPDTSPPRFSDITVSDINKTSATISWATLEKSDSQVEYWASPHQFSPLDETLVRSHVIQLIDLNPANTYRYRMMSRDAAGNLAVSDEYTLTTLGLPATFTVNSLEITPTEVGIGDEVTISVLVTNTGDAPGSYVVPLKTDGVVIATQTVTALPGGASQKVTFVTASDSAGVLAVDVGGATGSFVVKGAMVPEISVFSITPNYDAESQNLTFARVIYQVDLYQPMADVDLVLKVGLDGEPVEEVSLLSAGQLGLGETTGSADYLPAHGWKSGTYTFQAELYSGEQFYASTTEQKLKVAAESATPVVSWAILGQIIGVTLVAIVVVTLVILRRNRSMLGL